MTLDPGNDLPKPSKLRLAVGLVVSIVICFAAAGLGSLATTPNLPDWYADLAKPSWNPPSWIFGPVWTVLYLMMAVAAWLVWRQGGFARQRLPLSLFVVQLGLNTLWSVLFFGMQNPGAAVIDILLLWTAILLTLIAFWQRSRWAGTLLIPYLVWVSFATALNVSIWQLNA